MKMLTVMLPPSTFDVAMFMTIAGYSCSNSSLTSGAVPGLRSGHCPEVSCT